MEVYIDREASMKYYKFVIDGKIVGVSNLKMINEDGLTEVEITEQEYNDYLKKHDALSKELIELTNWFNDYYAIHEQKYRRLKALSKADDDGESATVKLKALYEEAEEKRKRLQKIQLNMEQ